MSGNYGACIKSNYPQLTGIMHQVERDASELGSWIEFRPKKLLAQP